MEIGRHYGFSLDIDEVLSAVGFDAHSEVGVRINIPKELAE